MARNTWCTDGQDFPSGLRLIVDGKNCLFRQEYDLSELRSTVQGKLVRFLVSDGDHMCTKISLSPRWR